ncbi:hypothetical protein [Candidatus Magnetominusculus dajiuhuensis]|uniref:hypothetical protein n=1 Tax=Candidatus Magnetominusculus dajiuhuensis TaxID=3137712 RepID=UPI003B43463D
MNKTLPDAELAEKLVELKKQREGLKTAPIEAHVTNESLRDRINASTIETIPEIIKEMAAIKSEAERDLYINLLSKKHGMGKRAISKDIQALRKDKHAESQPVVYSMNFPGLVDVVSDDGSNTYLLKDGDDLSISNTYEIDGTVYSPPTKDNIPFVMARYEDVAEWYYKDDYSIFNDLLIYLKRFSFLQVKQWIIVACFIFLTYIQDHPDIRYIPMLLFYAVAERGKSRTGKAIAYVSYRGVHLVDLREANIFRFSENFKATLFFDLMDLWKKAERGGCEDILLLRFEKGAKAVRVIYPDRGAFEDTRYYDIFGPTIMATNQNINSILDTRCLNISMTNKLGEYENPTPEKALSQKAHLIAWRAKVMDKHLPLIEHIPELTGRIWDISKPLLQVCMMVYPEGLDDLKEALIEISGQRIEDKKGGIHEQIVAAIEELSPEDVPEWRIKTGDIASIINSHRPADKPVTERYIGGQVRALGLKTKMINGRSHIFLYRSDFDILLRQYKTISSDISSEHLHTSTNVKELDNAPLAAGRCSNIEESTSTHHLPDKNRMDSASLTSVDVGRCLVEPQEDNILTLETDCEVEI